jgi:DNA-binding NtrC family response regulator
MNVCVLHNIKSLYRLPLIMTEKNIVLFEKYDGVRFVLERSLSKFEHEIIIHASHWKNEIKHMIDQNGVDLLVTELSRVNPDGLEISRYARKSHPQLKIIWITVLGCDLFNEEKEKIGNVLCIEKPLEINEFRENVLEALRINSYSGS